MSDIFISYASDDRSGVRKLVAALETHGWSVWWDRTIPPGKTFSEVIEEALNASRCVIVVWSEAAVASQWVQTEAGEGQAQGKLIPVLIQDVKPPLAFRQIHAAGLVDWQGDPDHVGFRELVKAMSSRLGEPAPAEAKPTAKDDDQEAEETSKPTDVVGGDKPSSKPGWMRSGFRMRIVVATGVLLAAAGIWGAYQYNLQIAEQQGIKEQREAALALEEEESKTAEETRRKAEEEAQRGAREAARQEAEEKARQAAEEEAQRLRVLEAQKLLARLGYEPGRPDGVEGPTTTGAVRGFKQDAGLRGFPIIDDALLGALRDAVTALASKDTEGPLAPGKGFSDCPECPDMVVVPAGSFLMGSPSTEEDRQLYEGPQHRVRISRPFAVGKYEVTFEQWDACVADGGCADYRPDDEGWGRGQRPVIHVGWNDAKAYIAWLRERTRQPYRLLTEAEWEYAARAGSETRYWWGDEIGRKNANCVGCGSKWDNERTAPVGNFVPNGFKISDTAGNLWEWVEDCWNKSYQGAPSDGSAWLEGDCDLRILRGGSWVDAARGLRSANRTEVEIRYRKSRVGFRVARSLP